MSDFAYVAIVLVSTEPLLIACVIQTLFLKQASITFPNRRLMQLNHST